MLPFAKTNKLVPFTLRYR